MYDRAIQELVKFGDLGLALKLEDDCVKVMSQVLGEAHIDTLHHYNNLTLILKHAGKLSEAQQIQEKCLSVILAHYGEESIYAARSYHNLGSLREE